MNRRASFFLVALLIVFAGCAGPQNVHSDTSREQPVSEGVPTTSERSAITNTVSEFTEVAAKERALVAEEDRITRILADSSHVTGSVGIYQEPAATVIDSNGTAIRIRVKMPYSFEYNCDNSSGAIDGLETNVIYRVSSSNVSLRTVVEGLQGPCVGRSQ